jgi:uncharacterized protein (DUF1684 family)
MKYMIILLLSLATSKTFAQDYKSRIDAHRKQYKQDFLDDKHSPLKEADLPNLKFFDADSAYRLEAEAELLTDQQPFQIPTFNGGKQTYVKYAKAKFSLKGAPYELFIYRNVSFNNQPGLVDYLFLPFTDKTNGNKTYGGGRYLDLKTSDMKNGHVEIILIKRITHIALTVPATSALCRQPKTILN